MAWLTNYEFYDSSNTGAVKAQVQTSWEIRGLDRAPVWNKKMQQGSEHGPPNSWCRSVQGARPEVAASLSRARCRRWMSEDAGRKERDWSGPGKTRSSAFTKSCKRPKHQLLRSARIWMVAYPNKSLSHMTPRDHHQSLCAQCSVGSTASE